MLSICKGLSRALLAAAGQTADSPQMVATEYAGSTNRLSENTFSLGLGWGF